MAARRMRSSPGSSGARFELFRQDDADADRARRLLPVGDDIGHRRIIRVDRFDQGELVGVGPLHRDRIAGVVLVHRDRRDIDRAVDADLIHRRHHLVAGDVSGPVFRNAVPRPLRRVRGIGVDLGIDDYGRPRGGIRSAHQRRSSRGERRRDLQHGTPVDKPVSCRRTIGHFPLHAASGFTLFSSMKIADFL